MAKTLADVAKSRETYDSADTNKSLAQILPGAAHLTRVRTDAKQTKWKVHPAAEVFPMLPDDELQELATDIKQNGLRESIKTSDGVLIDGRNRLAACEIANVEPRFEELDGKIDAVAYILSANINRRHLGKGQQAMAVAMIQPEPEKGGRGKLSQIHEGLSKSDKRTMQNNVSMARTIIKYAPDMADSVRLGAVALNDAYDVARVRKAKSETSEERLRRLQVSAPDLAAAVVEEKLKLPEAEAVQRKRQEQREGELRSAKDTLQKVVECLTPKTEGRLTPITGRMPSEEFMRLGVLVLPDFSLEELSAALQNLTFLVEEKKKQIASKSPTETAPATKVEGAVEREKRRDVQKAVNQQRSLMRRVSKKQTIHEQFADMLALANYSTTHDFMMLALENGWHTEVDFDKIPEYKIREFMKPDTWRDIVNALDWRRKRDPEALL
jgi:hypothetical protein